MATPLVICIIGLFLGSLLNVIIIRLPRERRLIGWPRCLRTGDPLTWWQLLPVVGWLVQRGRASDGRPLPWIYPVVELFTAVVLVLLYSRYGLSALFFYLTFVCVVLIITGTIDWLYRYIYTFVILGAALLALLLSPVIPEMHLLNAVLGALVAGFVFVLLFFLAKVLFPGEAAPFGLGDVYLAIFIGSAFGFTRLGAALVYGIFMAGLVAAGMIIARRLLHRRNVPDYLSYGTYLCLGAILYVVMGQL